MSVMNTIKKFNNNNSSPTSNNNATNKQLNNNEDVAQAFKAMVSKRENLQHLGGMSEASSEGTTHSVRQEEQAAFSNWINIKLLNDPDLKHLLPLHENGDNLYESIKDGILLCKIINFSCPDTIDERAINKKNLTLYTKHENLTLALNSAQAIGCNIVNIDAHDLAKGKPHLVLGLLWQIIRIGIFNQINLEHCPGLLNLVGGDIDDLMKMSPETILLRWVNHHLTNAGSNRRMNNFTKDITDSEIYTHLLYQIAPKQADVTTEALYIRDLLQRAETMLQQADKLGCRSFLSPQDVVSGIYKLNVAFLANLFNKYPALDIPEEPIQIEIIEETRAEKTWRNWMNSLGVSPFVNRLYNDIADGLVLIQLCDIIKPGIVQWSRVHKQFSRLKGFMERLENCNYTVELGKMLQFSLVGVAGQDIAECNKTLVSALIWQLMRAYTLSILTHLATADGEGKSKPVDEAKIVEWVNGKLKAANKTSSIRGFNDSSIATALPVIDLVDAIKPESVNYGQVLPGNGPEEKLANSKYAISMARKIGAKVYALPEDIAELKPKMVMTVFACLMARDYVPSASEPPAAISSSSGVDSSLSSSNNDSLSSNNTTSEIANNNKVPNNNNMSDDGLVATTGDESRNGNHH